jgi:hypothetical protein
MVVCPIYCSDYSSALSVLQEPRLVTGLRSWLNAFAAAQKLITNDRVARYLEQYQPEPFTEFQKIAEMTSSLPSEAA